MAQPNDPQSLKYYRVAKQRLEEAELILFKLNKAAAAQYLAGYAVECILKSLLLMITPKSRRSEMAERLKKDDKKENRFGHNLRGLRAGIAVRGLSYPHEVSSGLIIVLTWSPDSRYEPGPGSLDEATRFVKAVKSILIWAEGKM